MSKFIIHDLQTGGFSRHTSLDGIFEMCYDDYLRTVENDDLEMVKAEYVNASEKLKLELVNEIYMYELIIPTSELIEAWEQYHDEEWNEL